MIKQELLRLQVELSEKKQLNQYDKVIAPTKRKYKKSAEENEILQSKQQRQQQQQQEL